MEKIEEGFPDWTELGQDSGLDPLGMQRPIEAIYQSLVPGISTITLRYRYYSFFPFILKHYEENIRNPDASAFRVFHRRCEALYALICTYGERELGITGSDWAAEILVEVSAREGSGGIVDFSLGADPEADERFRYLRNKSGAFGAIYATQLREMGLLIFATKDDPNPNPVCSKSALELADAFARVLGELAPKFFEAVKQGQIAVSSLSAFEIMKPSRLRPGSDEHNLLKDTLLGKAGVRGEIDLVRKDTLQMLLRITDHHGQVPEIESVKWHWFDHASDAPSSAQRVPELWALYQACDLMRLTYETILSAALGKLSAAPRNRLPLSSLVEELGDDVKVEADENWQDFADRHVSGGATARVYADAMLKGAPEERLPGAVKLIAILWANVPVAQELIQRALSGEDYFYSLRTEARYLDRVAMKPAQDVVAELIRDRVLKRHLWVASRKFRKQKAYTFHMEPEDGVLRYRSQFQVVPSSPRIEQALRFLHDLSLIDQNGVTPYGRTEMAAA